MQATNRIWIARLARSFGLLAVLLPCTLAHPCRGESVRVYVGTYTGGESKGIYLLEMNPATGQVESKGLAAESPHPSFLALHPSGKYLYAVNETGDFQGAKSGSVSAFAVEETTGRLRLLNQQPSGGAAPCHVIVDRQGRHVLAANYGGGSVVVLPVGKDGTLGAATAFVQHEGQSVNPRRQEAPHAHSIHLDARNHFAVAADLGTDKVFVYRYDPAQGSLKVNDPAAFLAEPGSGPRHFDFHPSGLYAYVINELASTVTACRYDAKNGVLTRLQTLTTLPEGFTGNNSTADIHVHPTGNFVYGSNRGHDSLAVYGVDLPKGTLRPVQIISTGGKTPRNFGIDPSGKFLLAANQGTGNVVVFRIDPSTGQLEATGHEVKVPSPVCLQFLAH